MLFEVEIRWDGRDGELITRHWVTVRGARYGHEAIKAAAELGEAWVMAEGLNIGRRVVIVARVTTELPRVPADREMPDAA